MISISGQYPAAQYPRAPITPQVASQAPQKCYSSPIDELIDKYKLLGFFFLLEEPQHAQFTPKREVESSEEDFISK
jgi:hypothetical protein